MNSTVSETHLSRSAFIATLRNPNYAKLLTGQVIAAFGDRINQTALLSIVVYETHQTIKHSADIMFWAVMPSVALGLFAVALIDRWNRQRTMIVSDTARAILAASLPILWFYIPHHYTIYVGAFFIGAFGALFGPCRLAIMPNLVPRELLMSANAIASQAGTVATLIAMPISGWIVDSFGRNASFSINAITYLISAMFVFRLKPFVHAPSTVSPLGIHRPHPLDDLRSGIKYILGKPSILFYVIFTGSTQCLVAVFFVCFLGYGVDVISQREDQKILITTLLFGALGIGMVIGALWLGRYSKLAERFLWPMVMMGCAGVGIWTLSQIQHAWLAAIVLLGIGFCALMIMAPIDTFLQKHVPDELRGRVFAARGVLVGMGFLISLQFSKAIIKQLGVPGTMEFLGIASIAVAMASGWIGRRYALRSKISAT